MEVNLAGPGEGWDLGAPGEGRALCVSTCPHPGEMGPRLLEISRHFCS